MKKIIDKFRNIALWFGVRLGDPTPFLFAMLFGWILINWGKV